MKRLLAMSLILGIACGQLQAQEDCTNSCVNSTVCAAQPVCSPPECNAYCEGERASYMSALLPIGALVVAAVVIATTDSSHQRHSSSSSSSSHRRSSSCHSHAS